MLGQEVLDLTVSRETTGHAFRIDGLAVEMDFEDAIAALNELWPDAQPFLNAVRQTGGTGMVVSNYAVFDCHRCHC